jgi:hypothetical protein
MIPFSPDKTLEAWSTYFLVFDIETKIVFFFVQKEKRKHFYVTMTKWNLSAGVQSYIFLMICSLFLLLSLPFHSYCLFRVLQQKQEARKW